MTAAPQCQVLATRDGNGAGACDRRECTARDQIRHETNLPPEWTICSPVGDFGQHRNDSPESEVTVGFAASVALAAIALVESLTADLHREDQSARDGA